MTKKTVLIIGAGPGLGNQIARTFAKDDFKVALVSRNEGNLRLYAEDFKKIGIEIYTRAGDAAQPESLEKGVKEIISETGGVDVLVYNAAVMEEERGALTTTNEDFLNAFQVGVASLLVTVQILLPELKKNKGTILVTGGGLGVHPSSEYMTMSICKAALRSLVYILNEELKELNIFAGTVTIMGNIEDNTKFDPQLISQKFLDMYHSKKETECIFE